MHKLYFLFLFFYFLRLYTFKISKDIHKSTFMYSSAFFFFLSVRVNSIFVQAR